VSPRKEYRAKMRAAYGADWWKKDQKARRARRKTGFAASPKKAKAKKDNPTPEWEGFPRHVGGLPYSTLDDGPMPIPDMGWHIADRHRRMDDYWIKDALVYWGPKGRKDRHGQEHQGIAVQKTWGRWEDAFNVIELIRGRGERYTGKILTGAGREKTIRFLKGLKGYA
jgi:hypothetical protein